MNAAQEGAILVTGAAGDLGAIGRNLSALARRKDERAAALRRFGAEVVQGDLTDLSSMHRAIEGCARLNFGRSVSVTYLEATVNTAAVALARSARSYVPSQESNKAFGRPQPFVAGPPKPRPEAGGSFNLTTANRTTRRCTKPVFAATSLPTPATLPSPATRLRAENRNLYVYLYDG